MNPQIRQFSGSMSHNTIAFQGTHGAHSDLACRTVFPDMTTLACASFEDAFAAVRDGSAVLAMIPIENSVIGRIADIHHLLPHGGLHVIGEHFQRINHHLLAIPGTTVEQLRRVRSQVPALEQCRETVRRLGLEPIVHGDTAGAAAEVARRADPSEAAIASDLAAEIYGLTRLLGDIEDAHHNTTRFLIMAREPQQPPVDSGPVITSFLFRVRSVPASLFKALGGFATNGVNMTKLESYLVDGRFTAARFYADIEGHPESRSVRLALQELEFFAREVKILGVYPAHPFRLQGGQSGED